MAKIVAASEEFFVSDLSVLNTHDSGASIARLTSGVFDGWYVATWTEQSVVDGAVEIRGRLISPSGTLGPNFTVNTVTAGLQLRPDIVPLNNGGFAVTWSDNSGQGGDPSGWGVKAKVFGFFPPFAVSTQGEFLVNTTTNGDQGSRGTAFIDGETRAAALSNGNFVVVWTDTSAEGGDTSGFSVRGQLYAATGDTLTAAAAKVGGEFVINTTTAGNQSLPTVTALANGGFVATWSETGQFQTVVHKAQMFDATGGKAGAELLLVNNATEFGTPDLVALSGGGLVATWKTVIVSGGQSTYVLRSQVYDADGAKVGDTFDVVAEGARPITVFDTTLLSNGEILVTWTTQFSDLLKAQRFDIEGNKLGDPFTIDTDVSGGDFDVVASPNGNFVIIWNDGSSTRTEVKAQVFSLAAAVDAADDEGTLSEDSPETQFAVLANDSDATGFLTIGPVSVNAPSAPGIGASDVAVRVIGNSIAVDLGPDFDALQTSGGAQIMIPYQAFYRSSGGVTVDDAVLTIRVSGVDDAPTAPVDTNPAENVVDENAPFGTLVGITAHSTDMDSATVRYRIIDSPVNPTPFAIDPVTGVITLKGPINYESQSTRTVVVEAYDQNNVSETTFTVRVRDVGEPIEALRDFDFSENVVSAIAPIGTSVGITAFTRDPDAGSTVSYELVSPGGAFAVDPQTGVVTLAAALSHTVETTESITVRATSSDGSQVEQAFTVRIATPVNVIEGTPDDDVLTGTQLVDIVYGRGSDDSISGLVGDDVLYGHNGNDTLTGGEGRDQLLDGRGDDELHGDSGDDILSGGAGNDQLGGGDGADVLKGGDGDDRMDGGDGADILQGGKGNDLLTGGSGVDAFRFFAGFDDDVLADYSDGESLFFGADLLDRHGVAVDSLAALKAAVDASSLVSASVADDDLVLEFDGGERLTFAFLADQWSLL